MRAWLILAACLTGCPGPDTDTDTDTGADTDPDTALPAPFDLTATPGDGEVQLAWDATEDAAGFIVQRSDVSGGPYVEIGRALVRRFTDTGLTNGDTWFYVVIAANEQGESNPSAEASATVGP